MIKGTLHEVLTSISKCIFYDKVAPETLVKYAEEAPHAKTRPDGRPWPSGTGSISEKRILYAVARAHQPKFVVDIGTRWGSCTLQLLSANPDARLISIDIEATIMGGKQPVGKFIPDTYRYEQLIADASNWFVPQEGMVDMIFEDTAHDQETTFKIYRSGMKALVPGGIMISHDAVHPKFKGAVVKGISQAGARPYVYLVDGDSCGLSIWRKPTEPDTGAKYEENPDVARMVEPLGAPSSVIGDADPTILNPVLDEDTHKATPKRKRRKKSTKKAASSE